MIVSVFDVEANEVLTESMEADEFLEMNSFDEEVAELLNQLSNMEVDESVTYFGHCCDEYVITKLEDEDLLTK